jgi:hypothetical protein
VADERAHAWSRGVRPGRPLSLQRARGHSVDHPFRRARRPDAAGDVRLPHPRRRGDCVRQRRDARAFRAGALRRHRHARHRRRVALLPGVVVRAVRRDDRSRTRGRCEHVRAGAVHRVRPPGLGNAVRPQRRLRRRPRCRLVPARRARRLGDRAGADAPAPTGVRDRTTASPQSHRALLQGAGGDQRPLRPQRLQALRSPRRLDRLRPVPGREVLRARAAARRLPSAARADDDLRAGEADVPVDRDERDDRRVPDDAHHAGDRQRRGVARGGGRRVRSRPLHEQLDERRLESLGLRRGRRAAACGDGCAGAEARAGALHRLRRCRRAVGRGHRREQSHPERRALRDRRQLDRPGEDDSLPGGRARGPHADRDRRGPHDHAGEEGVLPRPVRAAPGTRVPGGTADIRVEAATPEAVRFRG